MLSCDFRRFVAGALVFATVFVTMPVSAADFTTSRSVIGSVSAVGAVELRGIGISQEGTLFAGDRIRAQKGTAKILLGTGSQIELSEMSDINVNRDAQGVKIAMNAGMVGFNAKSQIRIDVAPYEVTVTDKAVGYVVLKGSDLGIRSMNGKILVRNSKTLESWELTENQGVALQRTINAPPLAQVASNAPVPLPAPRAPQAPAGRASSGLAMDSGAWAAVIGGVVIGGIAVWGVVTALNNKDNIDDLQARINLLNARLASPSRP